MPPIGREIERLLIVCPSWVGDVVMSTCVFCAARQALPGARITALLRPGLSPLLDECPFVDQTITAEWKGMIGPFRTARAVRRAEPQAGLLLPNSFASALALRLARVPIRAGLARDGRRMLLTHSRKPPNRNTPLPAIDLYASIARFAFGVDEIDRHPILRISNADAAAAAALHPEGAGPFALLVPGANRPDKRWPADRFARIAGALHESHSLISLVSGSPGEAEVVEAVVRAARSPTVNLAQRGVTLGALKGLAARAAIVITNDTGPRHIAAALGAPVVTLFGPTDHRWTTLPGARERILLAEPFLPEELIADRHAGVCAISRIPVSDVIGAARALLDAPTGRAR